MENLLKKTSKSSSDKIEIINPFYNELNKEEKEEVVNILDVLDKVQESAQKSMDKKDFEDRKKEVIERHKIRPGNCGGREVRREIKERDIKDPESIKPSHEELYDILTNPERANEVEEYADELDKKIGGFYRKIWEEQKEHSGEIDELFREQCVLEDIVYDRYKSLGILEGMKESLQRIENSSENLENLFSIDANNEEISLFGGILNNISKQIAIIDQLLNRMRNRLKEKVKKENLDE